MTSTAKQGIDWASVKATLRSARRALEKGSDSNGPRRRQILQQRAEQLANPESSTSEAAKGAQVTDVLVFRCGHDVYGIRLHTVAQIVPRKVVIPVPGAPDALLGIANLEGEVRSVLALKRLLELSADECESEGPIVLLRRGDERIGLQVGEIERIRKLVLDELEPRQHASAEGRNHYIEGASPEGITILRTDRFFDLR